MASLSSSFPLLRTQFRPPHHQVRHLPCLATRLEALLTPLGLPPWVCPSNTWPLHSMPPSRPSHHQVRHLLQGGDERVRRLQPPRALELERPRQRRRHEVALPPQVPHQLQQLRAHGNSAGTTVSTRCTTQASGAVSRLRPCARAKARAPVTGGGLWRPAKKPNNSGRQSHSCLATGKLPTVQPTEHP